MERVEDRTPERGDSTGYVDAMRRGRAELRLVIAWVAAYAFSLETGIFLIQVFAGLGGLLAWVLWRRGTVPPLQRHPAVWPLLAAAALSVASAALNPWTLDNFARLSTDYVLPLIATFALLLMARHTSVLHAGAVALLATGVFGWFTGFVQHVTGIDPFYGQEIRGPVAGSTIPIYLPKGLLNMGLTYAGVQATIFLALLPIVWHKRERHDWWWWVGLLLVAFSVFMTYKRGPWLGAGVVTLLYLVTRGWRIGVATVAAMLTAFFGLFAVSGAFRGRVEAAIYLKSASENQRLHLWDTAIEMARDYPWLGVGPANWGHYTDNYLPTGINWVSTAHAHSDLLALAATHGIPAALAVSAIFFVLVFVGLRDLRRWREPSTLRDIYMGGVLSLIGFGLMGLFQVYIADAENLFTMGFVLGLALAAREVGLRRGSIRPASSMRQPS